MYKQMRNMSYEELAYVVISKYVGDEDIPPHILKNILHKSFSTFRSKGTDNLLGSQSQLVLTSEYIFLFRKFESKM